MTKGMEGKYDNYLGNIETMNMLIYVVTVFNLHYKFIFLDFYFIMVCDNEQVIIILRKVREVVNELYNEYKISIQSQVEPSNNNCVSQSQLSQCNSQVSFQSPSQASREGTKL